MPPLNYFMVTRESDSVGPDVEMSPVGEAVVLGGEAGGDEVGGDGEVDGELAGVVDSLEEVEGGGAFRNFPAALRDLAETPFQEDGYEVTKGHESFPYRAAVLSYRSYGKGEDILVDTNSAHFGFKAGDIVKRGERLYFVEGYTCTISEEVGRRRDRYPSASTSMVVRSINRRFSEREGLDLHHWFEDEEGGVELHKAWEEYDPAKELGCEDLTARESVSLKVHNVDVVKRGVYGVEGESLPHIAAGLGLAGGQREEGDVSIRCFRQVPGCNVKVPLEKGGELELEDSYKAVVLNILKIELVDRLKKLNVRFALKELDLWLSKVEVCEDAEQVAALNNEFVENLREHLEAELSDDAFACVANYVMQSREEQNFPSVLKSLFAWVKKSVGCKTGLPCDIELDDDCSPEDFVQAVNDLLAQLAQALHPIISAKTDHKLGSDIIAAAIYAAGPTYNSRLMQQYDDPVAAAKRVVASSMAAANNVLGNAGFYYFRHSTGTNVMKHSEQDFLDACALGAKLKVFSKPEDLAALSEAARLLMRYHDKYKLVFHGMGGEGYLAKYKGKIDEFMNVAHEAMQEFLLEDEELRGIVEKLDPANRVDLPVELGADRDTRLHYAEVVRSLWQATNVTKGQWLSSEGNTQYTPCALERSLLEEIFHRRGDPRGRGDALPLNTHLFLVDPDIFPNADQAVHLSAPVNAYAPRNYPIGSSAWLKFMTGCNGHCAFCENARHHVPAEPIDPERVRLQIEMMKEFCDRDGFVSSDGVINLYVGEADTLFLPTQTLLENLAVVRENAKGGSAVFTGYDLEIVCYGRVASLLTKTVEELQELKKAGLKTIFVGLESGDDEVLGKLRKGCTQDQFVEVMDRCRQAGIKTVATVIAGAMGKNSRGHVAETARAIGRGKPGTLTILPLSAAPDGDLAKIIEADEGNRFLTPAELEEEARAIAIACDCAAKESDAPFGADEWGRAGDDLKIVRPPTRHVPFTQPTA
jgi:hypothetical protein